jgi:NAD(P)-dependent dehydrogenase (short-subunit alcohol dehydrogenase family)
MAGLLDGKVALVTGGASGIGRAAALIMAREGARVMVSDVLEEAGEETAHLIKQSQGEARFFKCDVSNKDSVEEMVAKTIEAFGRLDCAFNNAGIEGKPAATLDCTEEGWERTIAVNLTGVWYCMRAEIRQMLQQGGGAIVNTASVAGLVGFEGLPAYVASKHGVAGLTKTAALEYAKQGVRVNAVCPGVIDTPMVRRLFENQPGTEEEFARREPVGRFGRPEEIGEAVTWLCSDASSFVTGVTMPVDGGWVAQ